MFALRILWSTGGEKLATASGRTVNPRSLIETLTWDTRQAEGMAFAFDGEIPEPASRNPGSTSLASDDGIHGLDQEQPGSLTKTPG